jgi:acyl carrier protein
MRGEVIVAQQVIVSDVAVEDEWVRQSIAAWLRDYLSNLLSLPEAQMDETATFGSYGIDSSAAVAMAGDLGDWIGCEVDPAAAYDHPSIDELSDALSRLPGVQSAFARRAQPGELSGIGP